MATSQKQLVFLEILQNLQESNCARVSYYLREFSKSTLFTYHLWATYLCPFFSKVSDLIKK